MKLEQIKSFQVDHTKFGVGMYLSRVDGDLYTYDLRMVVPNGGVYLSTGSMHTIEHLFATFARSSAMKDRVIYVGPMGCRTGFYLILKGERHDEAIALVRDALAFIAGFQGEIPGASEPECGNFRDHDLEAARRDVLPLLKRLQNYNKTELQYPV